MNTEAPQSEKKSEDVMINDGPKTSPAWIIIITSVLTVGMTIFNGFNAAEISKVKTNIEQKAQDLEAAKARVERYGFVQKLFPDLLSSDSSKRTLTINLVTLTLTAEEAQKLFKGLQSSTDSHVREVGDAGAATLVKDNAAPLVNQLNGGTAAERIAAFNELQRSFNSSSEAISQVLSMFEDENIDELSASGRINTLFFLAGTDATAWTANQIAKGEAAVALIEKRQLRGQWHMGGRTQEALGAFKKLLERAKSS